MPGEGKFLQGLHGPLELPLSYKATKLQGRGQHISACQWFCTVHKLGMVSAA